MLTMAVAPAVGRRRHRGIRVGSQPAGPVAPPADLRNANLSGANFTGADLTGADLSGATIEDVTWSNTICPDGRNSDTVGNTCAGHIS